MNSDKKQRNSYLDIMKGISIFLGEFMGSDPIKKK